MKDADSGCRILALAPNNWDGLWMNRQQLLSRLSETYPVLYSTGARSTWDRGFLSRGPGGLLGCFARHGGVTVDHPAALLLRIHAIPRLDEIAVQIAVRRWRRELARHGSRPLIAYAFHPQFQRYINALRPDFLIYHVYDLYWRGQGWSAENEAQQLRLLNEAGLVIASSTVIAHELSAKAGRRVHVVPNAVDYATFSRPASGPEPPDLALIPRPRIGH